MWDFGAGLVPSAPKKQKGFAMPTLNSETKAARIRKDDLELLRGQMKDITFSEWVHRQINGGIPGDIVSDFEVILGIYDTDFKSFFKALYKKVESGEIDVEDIMK